MPCRLRRAGSSGEAQQHGLGLVVERVPEEHRGRTDVGRGIRERTVARAARCRLGSAVLADLDANDARVEAEGLRLARGLRGDLPRSPA